MKKSKRDPDLMTSMARYRRAVNYLAAAQIYLKDNPLLEEPLRPKHLKERLLGHWGTSPGINLIHLHLNRLILKTDASILLITGPGHGAAANLANLYLEGTLSEYFPELTPDREGLRRFLASFSRPGGFPSHLSPIYPGVIHEGGELGYALSTAFGAVMDNPDLIAACIVGDGEAETGPTAGAWHSNKFLSPATDGAVLPILHLNSFKISNPTIFGTMDDDELTALFSGYGYAVKIVALSDRIDEAMEDGMTWAYETIRALQKTARSGRVIERPHWPLIILQTPKGWTGPQEIEGKRIEGSFRSHQVPAPEARTNPVHLRILETWLRSYRPQELFDQEGRPAADILALCPKGTLRMAMNPRAFGGSIRKPLVLPDTQRYAIDVPSRGNQSISGVRQLSQYLADVVEKNEPFRNFRIFSPDELESNRLGDLLSVTHRQYLWPLPKGTEHTERDGRIMEVLSEHNCQGWLQGYLLTGRHGIFPCYEAFISIVDGMMNQYAKFLKSALEVPWRQPISSLNYLLTSEAWRQEHNGYSHQGPGFINNLLTKKGHTYRIYFPPDANSLLVIMDRCLRETSSINLVVASKQPQPQWLSLEEAVDHCRVGASVWRWAGTQDGEDPQVVLACCGDNLTLETLAAADLLRAEVPEWRVRVVNVADLLVLGIPQKYPGGLDEARFQRLFPLDCPVIFNFHGYTAAIKQMCWERPGNDRFEVNGYREEGTTTTPFDMHIFNRTSRYHLVIQAAQKLAVRHPEAGARAEALIVEYERRISDHRRFIQMHGVDPPEITNWEWGRES
ncbi:MAG: phosphoketolase family protein [Nitrospirae bacterium]|nr:phosphoketolase family protein [Nitrospirota bacterium]